MLSAHTYLRSALTPVAVPNNLFATSGDQSRCASIWIPKDLFSSVGTYIYTALE
jgi:hypothetical protein